MFATGLIPNPFGKSKKLEKNKAQIRNQIAQSIYYRRFTLVALNNFEWINLPKTIKPRYIERALFYNGSCVFGKSEKFGYITLPCAMNGDLNLYYEPTDWSVIGNDYNEPFNVNNSVLMRNNQFCIPSEEDVMYYALKVADIERTIDTNLAHHKIPWMFRGTSKQILTLKSIFNKMEDNEPVVFMDDSIDPNSFSVHELNTPFIIADLEDHKRKVISEFYELYGYSTTQTEKSERLTMTESQVRVEFSDSGYVGAMFEYRKQACDEINRMFDFSGDKKIDVKINRYREKSEEFYELERMKLKAQMGGGGIDNGDLYRDTE